MFFRGGGGVIFDILVSCKKNWPKFFVEKSAVHPLTHGDTSRKKPLHTFLRAVTFARNLCVTPVSKNCVISELAYT